MPAANKQAVTTFCITSTEPRRTSESGLPVGNHNHVKPWLWSLCLNASSTLTCSYRSLFWEESEQVMINNFSEQGIPKMGKKVCEFTKGLMQGKAQVVLCQQPGIPEVHFGLRR